MRILSISLDQALRSPTSPVAVRQQTYLQAGDQMKVVVFSSGKPFFWEQGNLSGEGYGGASKIRVFFRAWRQLKKELRTTSYDFITAQDFLWTGLLAWLVARRRHFPLYLQDHSAFFARSSSTLTERFLRPFSKALARRARRIRTVSQRGKKGLMAIGIPAKNIDVIPIASNLTPFLALSAPSFDQPHVLCVARLEPEKGVDVLLHVWKEIIKQMPEARLRVVGDGSLGNFLQALAKKEGLERSVEFIGKVEDMVSQYAWSTLVVQPSRFEGWGMAVVEAAAAARPVVMTDVGCAGEFIKSGKNGLVVPVESASDLSQAILTLLHDSPQAQALGQQARESVQKLATPEASAQAIHQAYEQAVKPRLLILVQAVDLDDPLMGFFHQWLEMAAQGVQEMLVAALRIGRSHLPTNVTLMPLRPPGSRSRWKVIGNLLRISWRERFHYDSVFIRGDAQYVLLVGWLWRLLGKKVVFWYAHYKSNRMVWPASWFAHQVVTSVPEACPDKRVKVVPIGQGIDERLFIENHVPSGKDLRALFFSRISEVKKVMDCIQAFTSSKLGSGSTLTIIGSAPDPQYAAQVRAMVQVHPSVTWDERDVPYGEVPKLLSSYDVLLNGTPGSLDKVIVESILSGLIPIVATEGLRHALPERFHWLIAKDLQTRKEALERIFQMTEMERESLRVELRAIALRAHSLSSQIRQICSLL